MDYKKNQIKEGINLHIVQTNKFKTNLISVFLTLPLKQEEVTKQALVSAVLRRGSKNYPNLEALSIALEEMYGASFDCGIDKMGDNHILKFYIETIGEEFLPKKEEILKTALEVLMDIVFNPLMENQAFNEKYVELEKENLKQIIESKGDNKAKYALERCIEEIYKDKPYGLYKYGYIEDLEKINAQNLYETYQNIIEKAKIDIFVSGNVEEQNILNILANNEQIKSLPERKINILNNELVANMDKPQEIIENMDITQGKLVIGLNVNTENEDDKYVALMYNMLLGGSANSKLFQNVREKASLAYTAGSMYIRQKNNIFIRCGIEIKNYNKAKEIIEKQLEDLKNGQFSEEELQNAKTAVISSIDFIPDEQDTQIGYYFGQEFSGKFVSIEDYKKKIEQITKEQITKIAENISIHTIYFLKDNSKN